MYTLLNELHFWTLKNDIAIRDTDFGSFRYYEKRSQLDYEFLLGKKNYGEKRGIVWSPSNKRPLKLKDSLKELEEYLEKVRVVRVQWRDSTSMQLVFNSGVLVTLTLNPLTGDLKQVLFDKHLAGKLLSDYISDVAVCRSSAVFSYSDNLVTVLQFTKPSLKRGSGTLRKWSSVDSKSNVVELAGPAGRRLGRKLSFNTTNDKLLVWWKSNRDEIYPWSPVLRDQHKANVQVYSINNLDLELHCFYRTESDPVLVTFSCLQPNLIHSVQQKVPHKGEVSVCWNRLEINTGRLVSAPERTITLSNQISALSLSPREDKLVLVSLDGTILVADAQHQITISSKASFIASLVGWHPDSGLIVIANERGQIQFYDSGLSCVRAQLITEDVVPSNIIDVGAYFKYQPTLINMCWNKKPESFTSGVCCDNFLLLHFERGPVAVLRLIGGSTPGFSVDTMVSHYLTLNLVEKAVNLLGTLNWDLHGNTALACLQSAIKHLVAKPLTPDRLAFLDRALGCYYLPRRSFSQTTDLEFGDSMHDISRKVFHHVLRYQVVDKAFQLAVDIGDYDLFMDLHNYCKSMGLKEIAEAALEKAEEISEYSTSRSGTSLSSCSSSSTGSSASTCSRSSCSQCSSKDLPQTEERSHPTNQRQVKFSNTVTRITLPSMDELSIEEKSEERAVKAVGNMNTVGLPESNMNTVGLPESSMNGLGSTYQIDPGGSLQPPALYHHNPTGNRSEENGKIKVVHFGLV